METCTPFQLNETAKILYNNVAKSAPIYDYHCHLSPKDIAEDRPFTNITDMLLGGDHYKWRAMRYMGISEELITGNVAPENKFKAWAKTCAKLAGSPLYYWSHLEMKLFFGVEEQICEENSEKIHTHCNRIIAEQKLSPRNIIKRMNVRLICTTDDPCDTLEYHRGLTVEPDLSFLVLPTFRPDKALKPIDTGFRDYVSQLSQASGNEIRCLDDLLNALEDRLDFFMEHGCRLSDHSLESMDWVSISESDVEQIFEDAMQGRRISQARNDSFCFYLLSKLGSMYSKRNIAMQLHIGALRNTNSIMLERLGRDTGFDIVNDFNVAVPVTTLLDTIDKTGGLPRIILYTLNPKDYPFLASICPCFTSDGVIGKVQLGASWWLCDTKNGMVQQMQYAADYGLLSNSWGMLTDSRSFLSYARHHYFRMILCDYLGRLKDAGEFFGTQKELEQLVEDISYKNIEEFIAH